MNERIKDLLEEAGFVSYGEDTGFYTIPAPAFLSRIDRLAELIVRECFEHCKGQLVDKKTAEHMELTYNDAVGDCANGLLQHFGVKE